MKQDLLIEKLTAILETKNIEKVVNALKKAIPDCPEEFEKVEEEWGNYQIAKNLGLMDDTQNFLAFRVFFTSYAETVLTGIPEDKIMLEHFEKPKHRDGGYDQESIDESRRLTALANRDDQYEYTFRNDLRNEQNDKIGVRPRVITVVCILQMIGLTYTLLSLFIGLIRISQYDVAINGSMVLLTLLPMLLGGVHIYGLWKMKKWSVWLYGFLFLINLIAFAVRTSNGTFMLFQVLFRTNFSLVAAGVITISIITILLYWAMLFTFYKRMT